jgi:hypothetical protein
MLDRRRALGYVETELTEDSLWGAAGSVARGHEFHYSELTGDPAEASGWRRAYRVSRARGGGRECEGFTNGTVLASYVHLHFGSRPEMARQLYRRCASSSRDFAEFTNLPAKGWREGEVSIGGAERARWRSAATGPRSPHGNEDKC